MRVYRSTLAALLAVGCSTGTDVVPNAPARSGDIEPAPAEATKPAERRSTATPAAGIGVVVGAVRRVGDEVQIEVELDRPFPPAASARPTLQVGDEVVRRSRAGAGGRIDRLIFTMPAEQYERMPKDEEVIVRSGPWSNETVDPKSRLSDFNVIEGQP